jgi:ligand-binding SRPBCC domain-containing protein
LQRELVIDAPPEAVFAYLAEPERLPEWTPGVLGVRRTTVGPVGVGSTTEALVEAFGVRQTLLGRCVVFEPSRQLVVENVTAGGITIGGVGIRKVSTTSTSELLPEGSGTRLRASLEYALDAGFLSGLAEQVAGPRMRSDFEASLLNLKRVLDGRSGRG